ncbi:MAG: HEAT repeat domain-containing protein [Thermoanaerobaculia bacterium]
MSERPRPLNGFDEADRELVAALRSDEPDVRSYALGEVHAVVGDALARELLRFARDDGRDPEERGRALIALGPALEEASFEEEPDGSLSSDVPDWWAASLSDAAYRHVHDELRKIYHDAALPKLVRRRALEAAVRAPRDWQREATAAAWRSGDPEWRLTAVFAMAFLGGFRDEIVEAFGSDDPLVRRQAIRATGLSDEAAGALRKAILALAADLGAEREDRLAAIWALGEGQPRGARDLLEDLTEDRDPEIAEAAEDALEEIRLFSGVVPDDLLDEAW